MEEMKKGGSGKVGIRQWKGREMGGGRKVGSVWENKMAFIKMTMQELNIDPYSPL